MISMPAQVFDMKSDDSKALGGRQARDVWYRPRVLGSAPHSDHLFRSHAYPHLATNNRSDAFCDVAHAWGQPSCRTEISSVQNHDMW